MQKRVFVLVILINLFVASCTNGNTPLPTNNRTQSPTLTPTATPVITTPCPDITPMPTYYVRPKTIYILIDKSTSFRKWRNDAINILSQSLKSALQPGDYVYIGWIGVDSSNPQGLFFSGGVENVEEPDYLPYPDNPLSISNLIYPPPPAETLTSVQIINATATMNTYLTQVAGTATSVSSQAQGTLCEKQFAHIENMKRYASFEAQKADVVHNFVLQHIQPALKEAEKTPYDSKTRIYEALYIASRILQSDIANDSSNSRDYELVILSDMVDVGSDSGTQLKKDFSNVEITMAMLFCPAAISCEETENDWGFSLRNQNNAKDVSFLIIQETTVDRLLNCLVTNEH